MENCIFCKIVNKQIPKDFRFEDENIVAFDDIAPQADTHILFVPKKHLKSFDQLTKSDENILYSVRLGVEELVRKNKLEGRGYKIQVYAGGAQTVDHLHFHLIGPIGLKV